MQYLNSLIKLDMHHSLIVIYIFHEIRFRGYLVMANYMDFISIKGLYLMNYQSQPD